MSITLSLYIFEGPFPLEKWEPPYRAAVYAILIKPDAKNKPEEYKPIYFGESGNLSERGFYEYHHKYKCWLREAGSLQNLYIAYHLLPNSTPDQRRTIEMLLITRYHPICNE
jgi:hypothetical protein